MLVFQGVKDAVAPFLQLHRTFSVESSSQHRAPIGPDPEIQVAKSKLKKKQITGSEWVRNKPKYIQKNVSSWKWCCNFKEYHGYTF